MPSRRTLSRIVAATAVVGVVALGAAAVSARSSDGPTYRTATVGRHKVDQQLATVGTIEPVSQASVAFPVAGTVSSVSVAVGDTVLVGQKLASLDVTDLTANLHQEQAALDAAELTLELALAGQDVGSVTGGAPSGGGVGRAAAGADTELRDAQQAVLAAQRAVDDALAAAQTALDAAAQVCSDDGGTTTTTGTTVASTATPSTIDAADPTACQQALADSLAAQQAVATAQDDLSDAADALTKLLADRASKPGGTPTTTTSTTQPSGGAPSGSGSGPTGSSGSGTPTGTGTGSGSGSTASTSPSAKDLIAYQKQVDAAALAVAVADQAVAQATIVSPIAGTVASVGLAVGDSATAASSAQAIVVVGSGGFEVTTKVSVKDLPDVEVGQEAAVTPDGSHMAIAGQIVRIGVAGEGSGSSTTYPVTVALTGRTDGLRNGATASVVITTAAAGQALAVPTSAVTVAGTRTTVQQLVDGKAKTVTVEVGAVGSTYTEITKGLSMGDVVVLADLAKALPGSATSSSGSGSSTGNGGFPGGGFAGGPPNGFPGGGPQGGG